MQYISIPGTDLRLSNIVMGLMRLNSLSRKEAEKLIQTALDNGINLFDHADIYGGGACETLFAEAVNMNPYNRKRFILQSKCAIRNGLYDFSKTHIISSVDGILSRLKTDYLDILLLHRPDPLMDPQEVAEAIEELHERGKVRYFGVSNQNPMQIALLQKYIKQRLIINQLQLSVVHTPVIDSGIAVNMHIDQSVDRTGSIYEYCRLQDITIQAWSPFQKGFFGGPYLGDYENHAELNAVTEQIAEKYNVSPTAVAVAWLTRMPAGVQVILGTTKPERIVDGCKGSALCLTREEWYGLYKAAGNIIP